MTAALPATERDVGVLPPTWQFGTKAETLESLAPLLCHGRVLPMRYVTVSRWRAAPEDVLDDVQGLPWGGGSLIVRSSTLHEDDPESQQAGRYASVADVSGRQSLAAAISEVIDSYAEDGSNDDLAHHQVLVQPMVTPVTLSGVMFTCDPNTGAPYIVINYEESGDSAAVTSGSDVPMRTFYCWKYGEAASGDPRLRRLLLLAKELETLTGEECLDVEFAFDGQGTLCLLQVRRLPVQSLASREVQAQQRLLRSSVHKVATAVPHPTLLGRRAVFGIMPDWNPAEIIGVRPRPLALSLYRRLVTDRVWAEQRHRYGYRDVRGCPLMIDFQGLPYIDVRASFNSLVPADLEDALAARLVDFYLDRLVANPALHDKVEFDILHSCYTLTTPDQVPQRLGGGFSRDEQHRLIDSLRGLTNALLDPAHPARRQDHEAMAALERRWDTVKQAGIEPVAEARWLLDDCARLGTPAFAGFARLGFIAVELLRSLVTTEVLEPRDADRLMAGLDTVTHRMARDLVELVPGQFLRKYGHLRPGTYDIRSPRYDEATDLYFDWERLRQMPAPVPVAPFEPTARQLNALDRVAREHGLEVGARELLEFITSSIAARENSKFVFTRHLSEVLSSIQQLGQKAGLDVAACSYLDVRALEELYQGARSPHTVLADSARHGREEYRLARQLVMPPLITGPDDVLSFHYPQSEPNYITRQSVTGPIEQVRRFGSLDGKILLLPSGDPGFDWIFSHRIAGFVTKFGGANSHMAIRAHQLGIPAIIGVGEGLYQRLERAAIVRIDCANRRTDVLR
ncbi:PEP/pyruvate-binding domain-containing protein [Streptomyces sp. NPDC050619]|uniref:PEP/pyruvate-binding domain-containing protein n=1 Tax=Streptomyces sp. NPDC050619 TaxID=3157214 RepID=UPI003417BDAC